MACACSGPEARLHPTVALWPVALRESLRAALAADQRQMARFAAHHGLASAAWPADPVDPFFNVNTPEDLALAEALLGTAPGGGVVPPVGMPG
jgi:molybdopterin-guanine dinucleotide biosynthesis protein A